jgi:hypothetical protein
MLRHIYSEISNVLMNLFFCLDVSVKRKIKCKSKNGNDIVPVLAFLTEYHAIKMYWGSGQLNAPAALLPGKEPLVPIG